MGLHGDFRFKLLSPVNHWKKGIEICQWANMQICKYTDLQICSFANLQISTNRHAYFVNFRWIELVEICIVWRMRGHR